MNEEMAFKALSDPTRRLLLDQLFAQDGLTLSQLASATTMTRQAVTKHLRILEKAGLLTTRMSGREKLHHLNPEPVRRVHDRWIEKYTTQSRAMIAARDTPPKEDPMNTGLTTGTLEHRVYIKASPQAVWDALTASEWTQRYGYGGAVEFDLRPGGSFRGLSNAGMLAMGAPEVAIDGEVLEADPPWRLVQTWRMLMDPTMAAEGATRLTYALEERPGGSTRLTVTHEVPQGSMIGVLMSGGLETAGAGGGWSWILSGLKTVLETGAPMETVRW